MEQLKREIIGCTHNVSVWGLLLLTFLGGCVFRAYPLEISTSHIDRAIDWDGLIKIETDRDDTWIFESITKSDQGEYFGHFGRKGTRFVNTEAGIIKTIQLDLNSIARIKLEDTRKTRTNSWIINGIGFGIPLLMVVTIFGIGLPVPVY